MSLDKMLIHVYSLNTNFIYTDHSMYTVCGYNEELRDLNLSSFCLLCFFFFLFNLFIYINTPHSNDCYFDHLVNMVHKEIPCALTVTIIIVVSSYQVGVFQPNNHHGAVHVVSIANQNVYVLNLYLTCRHMN